jgi:hypothetical protein
MNLITETGQVSTEAIQREATRMTAWAKGMHNYQQRYDGNVSVLAVMAEKQALRFGKTQLDIDILDLRDAFIQTPYPSEEQRQTLRVRAVQLGINPNNFPL